MPPKPRAEGSSPSAPAKENAVDTSSAAFIVYFTVLKLLEIGVYLGFNSCENHVGIYGIENNCKPYQKIKRF